MVFLLGIVGGLLPDIDSDNSVPIKFFFNFLAVTFAFLALFYFIGRYSISEMLILWAFVFIAVRYVIFELFTRLTEHRGVFHSLLAAAFFGLLTTSISYHFLARPYHAAWLNGLFLCLGYLLHLTLDEICSVDLLNTRVKRSFGTALKPFNHKDLKASLLLALLTGVVFYTAPDPGAFWHSIANTETYRQIGDHLFPAQGNWFSGLWQFTT